MMADRNTSDLDPELQPLAQNCVEEYKTTYPSRVPASIIVTWRSNADQETAYDSGLSKCKAGTGPHNAVDDNGNPSSKAFDFACFLENGNYIADGKHPYYNDFAQIGKKHGLVWGGDWVSWQDWDHLELPTAGDNND